MGRKTSAAKQTFRGERRSKRKEHPKSRAAGTRFGPLHLSRNRLALAGILVLAFVLRVYRLMDNFPIVGDEGIYLRWAEIIDHQGQWFISLLDGKQPLSYWLYALTRFLWDGDPLLAGRLISVAAGVASTYGIYLIGKKASGEAAGLVSAGLYAVLPWAIMYDRLMFTESLVNLGGVAIVYTSLMCFDAERAGFGWAGAAGLSLGLAIFTKTTAVLFGFFPALAGLILTPKPLGRLAARGALIYSVALIFPVVSWLAKPHVETFETTNMFLHQTFFFVQPEDFLQDPFAMASKNSRLLLGYVNYYLTWLTAVASILSLLYLTWRKVPKTWLLISVSLVPIAVQVFILKQMFPTRYPFPHIWPLLLLIGIAAVRLQSDLKSRLGPLGSRWAAGAAVTALAAGPMFLQSAGMLARPKEYLHPDDSGYFLGTYAHAGFGVREAIDYLIAEARNGPFVLLTDAIWSIPADAMFPYLNHRYGIRVHEAWWVQLSATHPIMPNGKVELLKSHWERVKAGDLDFRDVDRVYYVTDTNHNQDWAVKVRQPSARLMKSFPKPGGEHAVNVYRLK